MCIYPRFIINRPSLHVCRKFRGTSCIILMFEVMSQTKSLKLYPKMTIFLSLLCTLSFLNLCSTFPNHALCTHRPKYSKSIENSKSQMLTVKRQLSANPLIPELSSENNAAELCIPDPDPRPYELKKMWCQELKI